MEEFKVIGLMSGSSMDGLDVAYCIISREDSGLYQYRIEIAEVLPFSNKWILRLENLVMQNAITYLKTHYYFGHYLADLVNDFIQRNELEGKVDFIASHGQTIFHQPDNKVSSQIGDGAALAALTGLPVVCDFRTQDIALNGEGTPIVPICEKILFPDYRLFMNLGGICNITIINHPNVIGFDVCAANLVLNHLAGFLDAPFDEAGKIAASGEVFPEMLEDLNRQWYYEKTYPKSLSGGWVTKVLFPILKKYRIPVEDKLRTMVESIACQVRDSLLMVSEKEQIDLTKEEKMLTTGGGAFNHFLIERINALAPVTLVVPDEKTVKFKEALAMALMGTLRVKGEVNVLSTVTGAKHDTIGGAIFQGRTKLI